jgi:hypothetical protein
MDAEEKFRAAFEDWSRLPSHANYDAMEDAFKDLRIAKDEQIAAEREIV